MEEIAIAGASNIETEPKANTVAPTIAALLARKNTTNEHLPLS
ncbi:hypothetical protein [Aurantimicrobium sp. MWH-Uga1]|nr:hypothetical protein [Aurantimicrobium sp. MWH-Uga1]